MKKLWLLGLALLAGSCSPAGPQIRAKIVDGAVVFEAYQRGMWPFVSNAPIAVRTERFAVSGRNGAVWVIERNSGEACRRAARPPIFPLTYGRLPACFVVRVGPKPLVPGTVYRVATGFDARGDGIIRIALTVDNPSHDDVVGEVSGWPRETDPDIAYPPLANSAADSVISPSDANVASANLAIDVPGE